MITASGVPRRTCSRNSVAPLVATDTPTVSTGATTTVPHFRQPTRGMSTHTHSGPTGAGADSQENIGSVGAFAG